MRKRSDILDRLLVGLRPDADGQEDYQVIGGLQDHVLAALRVQTAARSVWIKPSTLEHIEDRRRRHIAQGDDEIAVERDVVFVLRHMASIVIRPTFWAPYPGDPCKFSLVDLVEEEGRYLLVAVKFVWANNSTTGRDEVWVSSGWAMGHGSLRRDLKRGRLVPIGVSG